MHASLLLSSGTEPTSSLANNASKRPCRNLEVAGALQGGIARTGSWAARPLAVGSRPVELGTNTRNALQVAAPLLRSIRSRIQFNSGPRCLAASSKQRSAIVRRQWLLNGAQRLAAQLSSAVAKSCLSAALGPAEYRSAEPAVGVGAGEYARTKRRMSASAAECTMHSPQASNPSIERTFQRPLRALWPAAHVKR